MKIITSLMWYAYRKVVNYCGRLAAVAHQHNGEKMNIVKNAAAGALAVGAAVALLPGVAHAAPTVNWTATSVYGKAEMSMTSNGNLSLAFTARDTACDSKSIGAMAEVFAGGSKQGSHDVANYGGCNVGSTQWKYFDISDLGGNTSGFVTIRSCRVQRILGGDNFTSCGAKVSRPFSIS